MILVPNISCKDSENNTLTNLNLNKNKITDVGVKYLMEGLENNQSLKTICLANNEIGDVGVDLVNETLKKNPTMTNVDIKYNFIESEEKFQTILKLCKENQRTGLITHHFKRELILMKSFSDFSFSFQ